MAAKISYNLTLKIAQTLAPYGALTPQPQEIAQTLAPSSFPPPIDSTSF
ncbi:MAG: hypothetical protein WBB29_22160 [Geitlerinemataceae cyanobacterium]